MTDDSRAGDENPNKRYFRSGDRVFRQGDGWYYSLREGDRGPFQTEKIARDELDRFIDEQQDLARLTARGSSGPDGKSTGFTIDLGNAKKKEANPVLLISGRDCPTSSDRTGNGRDSKDWDKRTFASAA